MVLLLLEALLVLGIGVFIVWWTMFSGRDKGERAAGSAGAASDAPRIGDGPGPGGGASPLDDAAHGSTDGASDGTGTGSGDGSGSD